jgi:hypothetical protein
MITASAAEIPVKSRGLVYYVGRPDWLRDSDIAAMLAEAREARPRATVVRLQAHCPVGAAGMAFAQAGELYELIQGYAGHVIPSGNANYLYYDRPGAKIDPHIDSPDFPLQILLMLQQSGYTDTQRSALVVFPEGPESAIRITLDPGELVLFRAADVVHGRTSIGTEEKATLIGAGYLPVSQES